MLKTTSTKDVLIFNKLVTIKSNFCCDTKRCTTNDSPKLNLYIYINDICNAKCPFCNVYKKETNKGIIDFGKLKEVLIELKEKQLLNRIAIAGGETTLDLNTLDNVLRVICEVCDEGQIVTINTNGFNLLNLKSMTYFNTLTGIHLSRHHYDDNKNREIFNTDKVASINDIISFQDQTSNRYLLRLNCNLVSNYIDSKEEVKNYLNFAGRLKIFRVGFVSLMPLNQFCVDNFVDFRTLDLDNDKELMVFENTFDLNICECCNILFVSETGKPIDVYFRKVKELNCPYSRQLVYTNDNKLIGGFNQSAIY
jgi:molybdenum cofactor biosynthesis enzyme MoaA